MVFSEWSTSQFLGLSKRGYFPQASKKRFSALLFSRAALCCDFSAIETFDIDWQ